jgi:hypothetical protein
MNKYGRILLFGFLVWLIPFLASFLVISLRETNRVFFESFMPVVLTLVIVYFCIMYFKNVKSDFVKESIIVGLIWFCLNIIIDLMLFLPESPMQMSFIDYMMDIGFVYLMIIIIPVGFGYFLQKTS